MYDVFKICEGYKEKVYVLELNDAGFRSPWPAEFYQEIIFSNVVRLVLRKCQFYFPESFLRMFPNLEDFKTVACNFYSLPDNMYVPQSLCSVITGVGMLPMRASEELVQINLQKRYSCRVAIYALAEILRFTQFSRCITRDILRLILNLLYSSRFEKVWEKK